MNCLSRFALVVAVPFAAVACGSPQGSAQPQNSSATADTATPASTTPGATTAATKPLESKTVDNANADAQKRMTSQGAGGGGALDGLNKMSDSLRKDVDTRSGVKPSPTSSAKPASSAPH